MIPTQQLHIRRSICSFLLILLLMPLGHAAMILMEHFLQPTALHYCAFAMGAAGMATVIAGVFVANDTKATIIGLIGGLLFWTGWVEFLFSYYAWRYGVHCDLVGNGIVSTVSQYADGVAVSHQFTIDGQAIDAMSRAELKAVRGSRPEYLIMPATFGFWMMTMMLYTFCTRTGCKFFNWVQRALRLPNKINIRPITHLPAMTTFMELNMMMWTCYLLLMFCYDPVFLGSSHWATFAVGGICLAGSLLMFVRQLRIKPWGANIRMAIATVIVFWTFVEVIARNGILQEIWVDPLNHAPKLLVLAIAILATALLARPKNKAAATITSPKTAMDES